MKWHLLDLPFVWQSCRHSRSRPCD